MPTHYFIITNDTVKTLVNATNLNGLDNYLLPNELAETSNTSVTFDERLYHILSYATDVANLTVLNHFNDKINIDIRPDGNAYNLVDLSIENYINNYTKNNTIYFDIVMCLVEAQIKNHGTISCSLRQLIKFCDTNDNYDLLTILVRKYNISLWDIYHYSIAWNNPKVFDKLISEFSEIIDFEWTKSAIDMAYQFDHDDIICHVVDKIKTCCPKLYHELKHLENPTEIIIKTLNNLKIPPNVVGVKTSFDFNEPVKDIMLPYGLKYIKFGPKFNQKLNSVIFPNTIESITFGIDYNWASYSKSIRKIRFPKSLKMFYNNSCGCNESIDKVKFPDSLEILKIGYGFNFPIDKVKWPKSLKRIIFGCKFNQSLANVKFPESLDTIEFCQTYKSLPINTINHPITTLKLLCIGENIKKLPPSLKTIACYEQDKKRLCKLPPGCKIVKY